MDAPVVSVLMPNHNGGRFIAATIDSVLAQTFRDFEMIIVEDASTDDSAQIIASYNDPRIRVIALEQNEHICVALNTGLKAARGKYIARIDSDDCWMPDKLEKQIAYMEANPQCGASFTWAQIVDEEERVLTEAESMFVTLFRAENRPRRQWVHDFFFSGSCLCHPSAVFPRHVAEEMNGYRNSLVQIQDYDLWARIAKKYDLHILQEPLIRYRHCLQGGNVSARTQKNNVRSYYEFYNVLSNYLDDLSDEEFAEVFRGDFALPTASSHAQLQCERALLLLKTEFTGHAAKLGGMDRLSALIDEEETRMVLRTNYGITQMNLYELTQSNALLTESPETAAYQVAQAYPANVGVVWDLARQLSGSQFLKLIALRLFPSSVVAAMEKAYKKVRNLFS